MRLECGADYTARDGEGVGVGVVGGGEEFEGKNLRVKL